MPIPIPAAQATAATSPQMLSRRTSSQSSHGSDAAFIRKMSADAKMTGTPTTTEHFHGPQSPSVPVTVVHHHVYEHTGVMSPRFFANEPPKATFKKINIIDAKWETLQEEFTKLIDVITKIISENWEKLKYIKTIELTNEIMNIIPQHIKINNAANEPVINYFSDILNKIRSSEHGLTPLKKFLDQYQKLNGNTTPAQRIATNTQWAISPTQWWGSNKTTSKQEEKFEDRNNQALGNLLVDSKYETPGLLEWGLSVTQPNSQARIQASTPKSQDDNHIERQLRKSLEKLKSDSMEYLTSFIPFTKTNQNHVQLASDIVYAATAKISIVKEELKPQIIQNTMDLLMVVLDTLRAKKSNGDTAKEIENTIASYAFPLNLDIYKKATRNTRKITSALESFVYALIEQHAQDQAPKQNQSLSNWKRS